MKVDPSIFREYDIRGIAGEKFSDKAIKEYEKWYGKFPGITITPKVGEALGKAYGTIINRKGGKKVIIGHEERQYGKEMKDQFIRGVLSTGIDVDDAGISLTPIIYFSTAFYNYDGGVNVTGSHNVYFFNGFKMMAKNVYPVYGEEIQEMQKIIQNESFLKENIGKLTEKDVVKDYSDFLLKHNKFDEKFKVVVDSGNGSAGLFGPKILRDLGCDVVEMYSDVDASFPNHTPDPEDLWAMRELSERVVKEKADIGIGFDADGDRFGMIDEKGKFIYADHALLFHAKDILSRNKGKKILYDVKCTRYMETLIPEYGGVPLMHRTGHAPIKASMRDDLDIVFGGEISGHFFFAEEYFKIDDGVYSAAKTLSLLSKIGKPISEIFKEIPITSMTPEIKLPCADDKKEDIVETIKNKFIKQYDVITIDGARIKFSETSWGLIRPSNTSPYLSLRVEADTDEEVIKIKNILQDELDKFPEVGDKMDRKEVTSHKGKLGWI
ncbi:MAG: phosphomannomutase/phosphoglucomutase [Candidatus Delongbacteria bacterium]|nr:phosphomannomutase/phosphoglucomutase [Candidatus Delongbacteria bacterium]